MFSSELTFVIDRYWRKAEMRPSGEVTRRSNDTTPGKLQLMR
jgi:hypothetical protein